MTEGILAMLKYLFKYIFPYCGGRKKSGDYCKTLTYRRVGDLRIYLFRRDPSAEKGYVRYIAPVTESPAYRYIAEGDRKGFVEYHSSGIRKGIKRKHPDPYRLSEFIRLARKIRLKGYDYSRPPVKVKGDIVSDGMHRVCIVYALKVPDCRLGVVQHKDYPPGRNPDK